MHRHVVLFRRKTSISRNFRFGKCVIPSDNAVIDDAQLIRQTLDGNTDAFGELVGKYQDRLFNTLVHVTGNPDDAAEAAQDTFVQAFVGLDKFKGKSAFYTWLYRIAVNVSVSNFRKSGRTRISIDYIREKTGDEPIDTDAPAPGSEIMNEERAEHVRTAVAALEEPYRTAIVLREMEGLCYEEIATILDLPLGTVRSRLHRGRMLLRELLSESFS